MPKVEPTTKSTFLDELYLMVKHNTTPPEEYVIACEPVKEGETVVGPATEGHRLLYHLAMQFKMEADDYLKRRQYPRAGDAEDLKALEAKITAATDRCKAILAVLWVTVREDYGLWTGVVGLRSNNMIVNYTEPDSSPFGMFKKILES